jgi:hypothetical protein
MFSNSGKWYSMGVSYRLSLRTSWTKVVYLTILLYCIHYIMSNGKTIMNWKWEDVNGSNHVKHHMALLEEIRTNA